MSWNPFNKGRHSSPTQVPVQQHHVQQQTFTRDEVVQLLESQKQQLMGGGGNGGSNGGRSYPQMEMTKDEKYICKLLDPKAPISDQNEPFYIFAGESAPHLALTNIPDPYIYQRMRKKAIDLMRVHGWSASEYFEMRQLLMLAETFLMKSISYTRSSREREQLNESRTAMTVRDDRALQPRESQGILSGFMGGR